MYYYRSQAFHSASFFHSFNFSFGFCCWLLIVGLNLRVQAFVVNGNERKKYVMLTQHYLMAFSKII